MNYQERYQFRHANDTFWQRVEEAILSVAAAIKTEGGAVENHAARLVWAETAFLDPTSKLTQGFRNAVTMHNLIQTSGAEIADTNGTWSGLFDVVGSLVNDFA